jgi:hypothetical protein
LCACGEFLLGDIMQNEMLRFVAGTVFLFHCFISFIVYSRLVFGWA